MRHLILLGIAPAMLLTACQPDGNPSSTEADKPRPSSWINYELQKDAVFDPDRINTSTAPRLFLDDTLPMPPVEAGMPEPSPALKTSQAASVSWTRLPDRSNDVAIGWYMYAIDKSTEKLKRYNESNGTWGEVPGPSGKTFKRISAAKKSGSSTQDPYYEYLVAITSDGATYQYDGNWWYMNGGGSGQDISVSTDGDVHYVNTSNTLYVWYPNTAHWSSIGGHAGNRLASKNNGQVMLRSSSNKLWHIYWDAYNNKYSSNYMNAWNVSDVCGDQFSKGTGNIASGTIAMHVGGGYSYWLSNWAPTYQWTRVGVDYNTANLACSQIVPFNGLTTRVIQTNSSGDTFYTDFQ